MDMYIDDTIVKSKETNDHHTNLKEVFDWLLFYNMKLNP